jgi:methionine aminotransferase
MRPIDSKLPNVGTTIFTLMSQLAEQHGAVNLSQGFPDFLPPEPLLELVDRAVHGRFHQYALMPGSMPLRCAIAEKLQALYHVRADPVTEITVTSGATEGIFDAIQAVVRAGDEVIVFDPSYDSYEPSITLAGGRAVHVPLSLPHFGIDWERLRGAVTGRTRLVIVNSPHNPSGALMGAEDWQRLAELLRPFDCYLLSDEVYEHVVFDGVGHATALAHPELKERCFTVFSFGKTYHATGWKLGYCVAPPPLTAELRKVHQYVTFASTSPLQQALAEFMTAHPEHHLNLPVFYQERRDYFAELLASTRFRTLPAPGTYFQLADYSAISSLPDVEFARWLTIEHGVATIPISVFYESPPAMRVVRFCFAKQNGTLDAAVARLRRL